MDTPSPVGEGCQAPDVAVWWMEENEFGFKSTTVLANAGKTPENTVEIKLVYKGIMRKESSGVVYAARCQCGTQKKLRAVKALHRHPRSMQYELKILMQLDHPNTSQVEYYFYMADANSDISLHIVMEHMPQTLRDVLSSLPWGEDKTLPLPAVKRCMAQLLHALAHIHSLGICHRDVQPANIEVNPVSGHVQLSGFGYARRLESGKNNSPQVGTLRYRAPELLLGASGYTSSVDVWSAGCVLAEILLGKPMFHGSDVHGQCIEIIKVLGTPTATMVKEINPKYTAGSDAPFPSYKPNNLKRMFMAYGCCRNAADLCRRLLHYSPSQRWKPTAATDHAFLKPDTD